MNEHVGESGATRRETEQEKTCKKQEDKNEVQADLLVQVSESGANRRRQVYPKKPRYNLLTPDQLTLLWAGDRPKMVDQMGFTSNCITPQVHTVGK